MKAVWFAAAFLLALAGPASAQVCSPNCILGLIAFGPGNAEGPIAVGGAGNADGELVSVSGAGNSQGGILAIALLSQSPANGAAGQVAIAPMGNAGASLLAVSATGNSEGFVAVTCTGQATGTIAVSCPRPPPAP